MVSMVSMVSMGCLTFPPRGPKVRPTDLWDPVRPRIGDPNIVRPPYLWASSKDLHG